MPGSPSLPAGEEKEPAGGEGSRLVKLSKDALYLTGARVITSGLTFLLAIYVNRMLGPERAGIYNYAFALYTIIQVIPDFGMGNITIRDASRDHLLLKRYVPAVVGLRLLLGTGGFLVLNLVNLVTWAAQRSGPLAGEKLLVLFALSSCLLVEQPLSNTLAEAFISLERLSFVALVYLFMGLVRVALSVIALSLVGNRVYPLVLAYLAAYLYSVLHFFVAFRRAQRGLSREEGAENVSTPPAYGEGPGGREGLVNPGLWRYLLRSAWPLAVVGAGITVYASLDLPIISWFRGDREVGLYAAAGLFAKAFVFLTIAVNMALLPAVSRVTGRHPGRAFELWRYLTSYCLAAVLPLAVIVPILARPVLFLQGRDFVEAWPATWLTMAAMSFTFMTAVSFPFFVALNRQRALTGVILRGLVLKGGLNLVLVPLFGYMGAAAAVPLSEAAIFFVASTALAREAGFRPAWKGMMARPLTAGLVAYAAAAAFLAFLRPGEGFVPALRWALVSAAGTAVAYAMASVTVGTWRKEELRRLNRALTP